MTTKKKWSNRFSAPLNEQVQRFNASVNFDKTLAKYDVIGSLAHAQMLTEQGIISKKSGANIKRGLKKIEIEIKQDSFDWREEDEDVHFNIERRLIELIGDDGKKLHTARSRNDQVATDLRLYLRDQTILLLQDLKTARLALLSLAEKHADTLVAGMTHLQIAQPITFGHHLLAYEEMFARDYARLQDGLPRTNTMPLGSGALAGVGYPINREMVAKTLQFNAICQNSIDAVSDRDFVSEFAFNASLIMVHLSRLCEELILWSSSAFSYIQLSDSFCTGSSIMPQKKNPDVPELIRGKCGRVIGSLNALLILQKSQPLAYNKDNQEDKEPLFDCVNTVRDCIVILAPMIDGIQVNADAMRRHLEAGYPTATELADYLVKKGMPFRDAHGAVSAVVHEAEKRGVALNELSLADIQKFAPKADKNALYVLDCQHAVNLRDHIGGTAPKQVRQQIKAKRKKLQ